MQDGCKVYMDSYMALNGSWVTVTWTIFKNHLLRVGLTENREIMALQPHKCWFILFYHVWGPAWIESHWNSISWGPGHIRFHTTLEGPWPHYMILEMCWDGFWTLSFGLSQFQGHGSWLVCEMALSGLVFYFLMSPSKMYILLLPPNICPIPKKPRGGHWQKL